MNTLERRWLKCCVAFGVVLWLVIFFGIWWQESQRYTPDAATVLLQVIPCGVWAFILTMFVVGIPSRIAINLAVAARRRSRRMETAVLVMTFAALCGMFYSLLTFKEYG